MVPRLIILGGVNGSGKSTLAVRPETTALFGGLSTINPDEYTKVERARHRISLLAANLIAVNRTELDAWRAVAEHRSVALETVLSSEKYLALVDAALARKFEFHLYYVGLPSLRFSIDRVRARKAAGGHGVPAGKLRERWPKSLDNFVRFLDRAHEVVLFSNAGFEPRVVGSKRRGEGFVLADRDELPEITRRLESQVGVYSLS